MLLELVQLYNQNSIEKFFIFTIYQNCTLALGDGFLVYFCVKIQIFALSDNLIQIFSSLGWRWAEAIQQVPPEAHVKGHQALLLSCQKVQQKPWIRETFYQAQPPETGRPTQNTLILSLLLTATISLSHF